MMNSNYLLNKHYYDELKYNHFEKCNKALCAIDLSSIVHTTSVKHSHSIYLYLQTVYPGLLFGIGNIHETNKDFIDGDEKDGAEIKLGFTLDYVTGLPIIPGSSIKGVLSSAFENYPLALIDILNISEDELEEIKKIIFGDKDNRGKCIFYDAVPIKSESNRLFGLDNITPHSDVFKNPVPLTMLKVIPGVTYLFQFDLSNFKNDSVTPDKLSELFEEILTTLGVGAKTNVGYGIMIKSVQDTNDIQLPDPDPEPKICLEDGCDKSTGFDKKNNKYYDYCGIHSPINKRKRVED